MRYIALIVSGVLAAAAPASGDAEPERRGTVVGWLQWNGGLSRLSSGQDL